MSTSRRQRRAARKKRNEAAQLDWEQARAARAARADAESWQRAAGPAFAAGAIGFALGVVLAVGGSSVLAAMAVGAVLLNVYAAYVIGKAGPVEGSGVPLRFGRLRGDHLAWALAVLSALLTGYGLALR